MPAVVWSAPLPGAADVSRVKSFEKTTVGPAGVTAGPSVSVPVTQAMPAGAKGIRFVLNRVVLEGSASISQQELASIYEPFIGREVTLDVAWAFAAQITERYRQAGYFLSRAYVPAQEIDGGVLRLAVVEGRIDSVIIEGIGADVAIVKAWVERIQQQQPAKIQLLEEALLELGSLGGMSYRAVLEPGEKGRDGKDGVAVLKLIGTKKADEATIRMDNNGSRYLGPYQAGASYTTSFLPGHSTSFAALVSMPWDELQSASLLHTVALWPQWSMDVRASYAHAEPGYKLAIQEIDSTSTTLGLGLRYHWIRQRDEVLSSRIGLDWVDSTADILGTPLTRDRIRVARGNVSYAVADRWGGHNALDTTLSRGLSGFGASHAKQANLSRAEATPDFTKLELQASRTQSVWSGVELNMSVAGQVASGALYASEEFGYGGTAFGRAYDNSEMVGDQGVSGALELRYTALGTMRPVTPVPYVFYDIGKVWNEDTAQRVKQSGSSAGFGSYFKTDWGLVGNVGLAWPLTHAVSDPIYTNNSSAPRVRVETSYHF